MNLHQIASGAIGAVNPFVPISIRVSTGSSVNGAGQRTPTYAPAVVKPGQLQALTFRDIQQLEGLNLQGTQKAVYINGHVAGLVRVLNKGGDLITFPDGSVWLVTLVLEHWPDWTKCAVTLQDGS